MDAVLIEVKPEEKVTPTQHLTRAWEHPSYLMDFRAVPGPVDAYMNIIRYSLSNITEQPQDYNDPLLRKTRKIFVDGFSRRNPLHYIKSNLPSDSSVTAAVAQRFQKADLLPKPATISKSEITCKTITDQRRLESWLMVMSFANTIGDSTFNKNIVEQWNNLVNTFPLTEQDSFTITDEKSAKAKKILISMEQKTPQNQIDFVKQLEDRVAV